MKDELITAINKVSEEEFNEAAGRWLQGFNAEAMLGNFISILEEYHEFDPNN